MPTKTKTKPGPKRKLKPKRTRTCQLSRVIDMLGLSRGEIGEAVGRDGSWLSKVTAGTVGVYVQDAQGIVDVLNRASKSHPTEDRGQARFHHVGDFWTSKGLLKS